MELRKIYLWIWSKFIYGILSKIYLLEFEETSIYGI